MENKTNLYTSDSKIQLMLSSWIFPLIQIVLGSLFLGMMAQIAIPLPFTPVPITLQSFTIALLAMTLGSKKAPLAVMTYLAQATIGLPVLAGGHVNPLWIVGPTGGYLIGFLAASCVTAYLLKYYASTLVRTWSIFVLHEAIILLCGSVWLGFFAGWQQTFFLGVLPFLPGACMKSVVTTSLFKPIEWVKSKIA